jgi:small subunit ribosomal protein S3e
MNRHEFVALRRTRFLESLPPPVQWLPPPKLARRGRCGAWCSIVLLFLCGQRPDFEQFVADGLFYAELNELLTRELAEDVSSSHSPHVLTPQGYAGVEVRPTPNKTEIVIRSTKTKEVLGEKGRRIRELCAVVQKRFGFAEGAVELLAERVANRGLCAMAQAESLKYKLLGGLAVRRACYGVVKYVMDAGAKGVEVVVTGKLRAQRAKAMAFRDGYMIHSGQPSKDCMTSAVRHVLLKQGEGVGCCG